MDCGHNSVLPAATEPVAIGGINEPFMINQSYYSGELNPMKIRGQAMQQYL